MPLIAGSGGDDADDSDIGMDRMTEEELLRGLEGLVPPQNNDDDERE